MNLVHIYIQEHKAVRDLNISLGGEVVCRVDDHEVFIEHRADTSSYYNGYHCSAIIGANGVGKSSILDFLESVYFPTDSSGVLIFLDSNSRIHICQINYHVNECSLPFDSYDGFEYFASAKKLVLVKINNVSVAQSRFGYQKRSKHRLIEERSLEQYASTKSQRKKYFANLLGYLRWRQSGRDAFQDVGFEFKIQNSFGRLGVLANSYLLNEQFQVEFKNAYSVILNNRIVNRPVGVEGVYEYLVETLSISILVELAAASGNRRTEVLATLNFYFVKALSLGRMNSSRSIFQALEALRYDENWEVFKQKDSKGKVSSKICSLDIDLDKMQRVFSEYLEILSDVSEMLSLGVISIDDDGALGVIVDDFTCASEIVHLVSKLPRNILSNISWGWRGLSTGEMAYTHIFSETYNSSKGSKPRNFLILIDEADLYLHPEWQRGFLDSYLELLDDLDWGSTRPQLLITTHSPIIVSDFLPQDIVSLAKADDGQVVVKKSLGFGTNITNLFVEGMHIKSTIGEHSRKAIVSLVSKADSKSLSDFDKELVKGMGNKFVREYLLKND